MSKPDPHAARMQALVRFTETSFETDYPSPFGSSIYDTGTGEVLGQAYDTVMRDCDPTNHAEVNAIRVATRTTGRLSLAGCTLYSTCEPCPMCMSACIWAELDCVVFGASTMEDANLYWPQSSDLSPAALVEHALRQPVCELIAGVERTACQELFRRCDTLRLERGLKLPPHRGNS